MAAVFGSITLPLHAPGIWPFLPESVATSLILPDSTIVSQATTR